MTFEEFGKALKEGKAVTRRDSKTYLELENGRFIEKRRDNDKVIGRGTYLHGMVSVKNILNNNTHFEIYNKPILDKQEKKYLKNFLRPYTKKYEKITITKASLYSGDFTIRIGFFAFKGGDLTDILSLPLFSKNEPMYKGMEPEKEYTLEELGL